MKKVIIPFVVLLLALTPVFSQAQTVIDNLYQKYAGKQGFTSINISPEMFQLLASMDMQDSSKTVQSAQKAMEELKGIKMLVCKPGNPAEAEAFYREIQKVVPMNGFKELMSVDSPENKVKFLADRTSNGKIKELLMIVKGDSTTMIMSLTGLLDMKTIGEISQSLHLDGMKNLQKLHDKNGK